MSQTYNSVGDHAVTLSFSGTQAHTIMTWVYPTSGTDGGDCVTLWDGTYTNSSVIGFNGAGGITTYVQNGASSYTSPAQSYSTNAWIHFASVFDGSNVVSYLNGVQVDTHAFSLTGRGTLTQLQIGMGGVSRQQADVMLFSAALTQQQVIDAMRGRSPHSVSSALYAWWPLDNGLPLIDRSGNARTLSNNSGTPAAGTVFVPTLWADSNSPNIISPKYVNTSTAINGSGADSSAGSGSLQNLVSASGGVASAGTAALTVSASLTAAGGIASAGTATRSVSFAITAAGGIASAGTSTATEAVALSGSGGVTSASSGPLSTIQAISASGGVASAGTAPLSVSVSLTATGAVQSAGSAPMLRSQLLTAAGGVASAGTSTATEAVALSGSGGITSAGTAARSVTALLTGAGGVTSAGSASASGGGSAAASGDDKSAGTASLSLAASLTATGAGASSATGALGALVSLQATGALQLAAAGVLAASVALSASGASASAATGTLTSVGASTQVAASGAGASAGGGLLSYFDENAPVWAGWSDGGDLADVDTQGAWTPEAETSAGPHGLWAADAEAGDVAPHGKWYENPVSGGIARTWIAALGGTSSAGAGTLTAGEVQPTLASTIGGGAFDLQKDWVFGTSGNINNFAALNAEFTYHDPFNTITNGENYGALMVRAPGADTFGVWNWADIGMSNDQQPVDPGTRYREFTSDSMLCHVKPLDTGSTVVGPASAHNAGCGSLVSKLTYSAGGTRLGQTIVWETRVRVVSAPNGYWFALWLVGPQWDGGPEIDLVESFSSTSPNVNADLFNSNGIGGTNSKDYFGGPWEDTVSTLGIPGYALPGGSQSLRNWHTFTLCYASDNTFQCYMDSTLIQSGTLDWKVPTSSTVPTLQFLFDFGFGHTAISPINAAVISDINATPLTYEIAYSRIWLR